MEGLSLALGIVLMLVAAIGGLCYVALVIAIPVCRLLDWFAPGDPALNPDPQRPGRTNPWRTPALASRLYARVIVRLPRKHARPHTKAQITLSRQDPPSET